MEEKNQTESVEEELEEKAEAAETEEPEASEPESEQADGSLEALKKEAEENYNRYLRVQADFDNFRKRTRKEKEEMQKYASLPVVEGLLPCIDNLERALQAAQDTSGGDSLTKGVEMVFRQML